jgi:hypothetical protein
VEENALMSIIRVYDSLSLVHHMTDVVVEPPDMKDS